MRRITSARLASCAVALGCIALAGTASATNGFEFPEHGTEQFGRGGAWVARATNGIATVDNPAALALQGTSVGLDVHLMWNKVCFARQGAGGAAELVAYGATAKYPTDPTCNENSGSPFPNPTIHATWRVSDKLGLGFFVGGPNMPGKTTFPDTVQSGSKTIPAPTRYMLLQQDGLIVLPTIGAGYSVLDNLQLGASFTWGLAKFQFQNVATALYQAVPNVNDTATNDVKATLDAHDWFIPSLSLAAMYQPTRNLDLALNWHWSDDIRATGQAHIEGPYYKSNGTVDTPDSYCPDTAGHPTGCVDTPKGETTVKIKQPMQVRAGVRFHQPRTSVDEKVTATDATAAAAGRKVRDPLSQDVFDVELDLTWANNSRVDNLEIRFNAQPPTIIPAFAGGIVPANADVAHQWKDVIGVRLGGDYVVVPNRLAVRAGGFFETRGQDPAYANIDFVPAQRFGVTGGATYRIGSSFDVLAAFGHVFGSKLDNSGKGDLPGLAGNGTAVYTDRNGVQTAYRTPNAINNGWVQQTITVASIGLGYRF